MWDDQVGEQDAKSRFASWIVFNVLTLVMGAAVLVTFASYNRDMGKLLEGETCLIVASLFVAGLGYLLMTNKDFR